MTIADPDTNDRTPTWMVYAIFDPDGLGGDFSYTDGLHELGLPELWISARPSLGDDPGADWKFSQRDTCLLLNELAWEWLDGKLRAGDRFERSYDFGLVTARFQIDPPDDPDLLEALRIGPGAQVVPVRWSLHRPDVGTNDPMTADATAAAEKEILDLLWQVPGDELAPAGWELPTELDWSVDGKYGPRTPLVLARAAYFWTCDEDALFDLIAAALDADQASPVHSWLAIVHTVARAGGRERAIDALKTEVGELLDGFEPLIDEVSGWGVPPDEYVRFRQGVRHLLFDLLFSTLAAEAVADLLPDEVRAEALSTLVSARLQGDRA